MVCFVLWIMKLLVDSINALIAPWQSDRLCWFENLRYGPRWCIAPAELRRAISPAVNLISASFNWESSRASSRYLDERMRGGKWRIDIRSHVYRLEDRKTSSWGGKKILFRHLYIERQKCISDIIITVKIFAPFLPANTETWASIWRKHLAVTSIARFIIFKPYIPMRWLSVNRWTIG